jgi:hypothetical protein
LSDACGDAQGQHHGPSQLSEQETRSRTKQITEPQKQLLRTEFPCFGILPKGTKAFLTALLADAAIQQAMASYGLTATQVERQYKSWRKKEQELSGEAMPTQHQSSDYEEIRFLITGRMHYSSASAMMTVGQKIMLKREENEHDDKTIRVNDTNGNQVGWVERKITEKLAVVVHGMWTGSYNVAGSLSARYIVIIKS